MFENGKLNTDKSSYFGIDSRKHEIGYSADGAKLYENFGSHMIVGEEGKTIDFTGLDNTTYEMDVVDIDFIK